MNSLDESEEDDESSSSKEKSSSSEDKGAEKQSSSSKKSSDGEKDASSSSKNEESSSSGFEISKTPSSSSLLAMNSSSSGTLVPRKPFGTCAPSNLTAEKDQAVTWDFTWDLAGSGVRVLDALKAEYSWNLPGGTASTDDGAHSTSVTATYSTTGAKTASVSVTVNGEEQTIDCSPLNVNGIPITGCECVSTNIQPDVSANESATWTAKGCTSNANITGYTWTGATADATGLVATAPVAAKDDVVSGVSFTVENDDNTKVIVQCEDAVAVDSRFPDYLFEIDGYQVPMQKLEVVNGACMSIRGTWENSLYTPMLSVYCDGSATEQYGGVTFEMSYGSIVYSESNSWGIGRVGGEIGVLKAGPVQFDDICVTFTGMKTVTCGLQ